MDTAPLEPTGADVARPLALPQQFGLTVSLDSTRHTYGEAVQGCARLKLPISVNLELLELKFTGICGTGIKYSHDGRQTPKRLTEERNLFTHTQTVISEREARPGNHKFPFVFRFPRRDEVELAPGVEPFSSDNYFYLRYRISATAIMIYPDGQSVTLTASRQPEFISSRDTTSDDVQDFTRIAVPAEPQNFVKKTILGRRSSTASISDSQEQFTAVLRSPRTIRMQEDISLPITLRTDSQNSSQRVRRIRLSKVSVYLRSKVRLTAQNQTTTIDMCGNAPIQIASMTLRKSNPGSVVQLDQETDTSCQVGVRMPHYLRATFLNDLIAYEYLLKVKAEFDIDGRTHVARFDHIPVILQPYHVQPEQDEWDYAASPPELTSESNDDWFTPPPSLPVTPPPEFSEFADEEVERRYRDCLRQDSWGSLYILPEPPEYEGTSHQGSMPRISER